jgi:Family of unknown function (DUF6011)
MEAAVAVTPQVIAWLSANAAGNEFAASLNSQWLRKGALSERQIAAVERNIERAAQQAQRNIDAPKVDVSEIEARFEYAKAKGVARPMLRLGIFKFKPASAMSSNYGAIYVTGESDGVYYGKISKGQFFGSRECTADYESSIVAVASDPAAYAKAYGQRTGNCCVCGRLLTKEESIDRMIGPICASRYGF